MKLAVFFALTMYWFTFSQGASDIIYPYCRCCDDYSESLAVENLVKWCELHQSCSPVHICVRNCLHCYNSSIYIKSIDKCSIDEDSMLEFYKWLLFNYQCLPHSLLDCVKKCITNFERYPSCYWTVNAEIGVLTKN